MDSAPARSSRPSPLLRFAVPVLLAGLMTACPGGGKLDNPGEYLPPNCDPTAIFLARCDGPFCHGGNPGMQPSGGVELITPPAGMTLGQSLYDVEGFYPGAASTGCPPAQRDYLIDGTTPSNSLLLKKLDGRFTCGTAMPPAPALSDTDLQCITLFVNYTAATGGL